MLPSGKIRDIRGETFGRLTVVSFSHIADNKGRNAYWNCICECGATTKTSSGPLRAGSSRSCGCLARELSRESIKRTHNKGAHLYFIRCGDFVKIGRADNPNLRLNQIKTANPYPVELLHVYLNAGGLEKHYHRLCASAHHTGEWFWYDGVCEVVEIGKVG